MQQLSAIGKAVCFAPSTLKTPNTSVLADEVCANVQHLNLETSAVSSRDFLKSPPCLRAFTCAGVMFAYHAMQIPIYAGHEWRGVPNVVAIINIAYYLGKECNDL